MKDALEVAIIITVFVASGFADLLLLPRCDVMKAEFAKIQRTVKTKKYIKGVWVSKSCETWTGPKFVLRRYEFQPDLSFRLLRFYYSDPWCRSPSFSVAATGRLEKFSPLISSSWVVPGGLEPDYVLHKISVVSFAEDKARLLHQKANHSCPGVIRKQWRLRKKYTVLDYNEDDRRTKLRRGGGKRRDIDCTPEMGFSFNELQLLRIERRRLLQLDQQQQQFGDEKYSLELLLGGETLGENTRPTFYKVPLIHEKVAHCSICQHLIKSTIDSPPRLPPVRHQEPMRLLSGGWISQRCEVRPHGLFLIRQFAFSNDLKRWTGQHIYYRDHKCQNPMFVLDANGIFFKSLPSTVIPGATNIDFQIQRAALTPKDKQFVENLNGFAYIGGCGPSSHQWILDKPGNLTATKGCNAIGVLIPSVEYDIIKLEKQKRGVSFLYLGQDTEDESRPTSFQPPLSPCYSGAESNKVDNALQALPRIQQLSLVSSGEPCLQIFVELLAVLVICSAVFRF